MPAKPVIVTNNDLPTLLRGLKALDGVPGKDGPIRFDFGESLVWNAAKARTIIDRAAVTFENAKTALAANQGVVDGQKLTDENAPRVAKYLDQVAALGKREVELTGILLLSRKDLQKGGLNLPNVFADLMPILEDK